MRNKLFAALTAGLLLCGVFTGCGKTTETTTSAGTAAQGEEEFPANAIVITLHADAAPITCENFEKLVNDGFYNGVGFHRVVDDFMAQGGDPTGTGMGGSDQNIKGEFASNGVQNPLSHKRGVVSMARSQENDSASSQFFICYTDCSFLDGNYAAFGEVTYGMDVVDDFLKVERVMGSDGAVSSPTKPITMQEVKMISDDAEGNHRVEIVMNDFLQ
ncbi:MAG: peptidylprolyl isomerase [Oscillospiraceae bacterium]|nr:peptidylprolyl isomerase [Oscillospiraceae bacterium]